MLNVFRLSFTAYTIPDPLSANKYIGFANYVFLPYDPLFVRSLTVTGIFVVVALSLELILGFFLAYLVFSLPKFSYIYRVIFSLPIMIMPLVSAYLFYMLFASGTMGWINAYLSLFFKTQIAWLSYPWTALFVLIMEHVYRYSTFAFLIFFAGFTSIPKDILDASLMETVSEKQRIRYIYLPFLKPHIVTAAVLLLIDLLKVFDSIWIITGGGPERFTELLNYYIFKTSFQLYHVGYGSAMATLIIIFLIIVTILTIGRKMEV